MKTKRSFGFSYLDAFFLLLAGLILSLGIYFFAEYKQKEAQILEYRVELSAVLEDYQYLCCPKEGDSLFDESGNVIGTLLFVSLPQEDRPETVLICSLRGIAPEAEKIFRAEFASCILHMNVTSVQVIDNSGGAVL